ncbi:MAG TPA: universal stress protein [Xanthobacteraceae bacterium]|nr:universal stress protein [Xanthobacteraceae bacterium]
MAMKTILVPTENHAAMRSALETALLLAKRCDGYIEGFALQFGINEFSAIDMGGGLSLETFKQESQEEAAQARKLFEAFMQENRVPRANGGAPAFSFGWLAEAPEGESFVGSYGRVFDIIVLSRPDANTTGLHNKSIESGLFESGRPILIAPPKALQKIATNVLIAWNRSTEQARATALAMPLLQDAERVTVLTVAGGNEVPGPSADQMLRYLQRNKVNAKAMTVELGNRNTGEAVLATAESLGCDLLIKGAYTQSRLRQMIFGGTTRHILANASLPVLLAH